MNNNNHSKKKIFYKKNNAIKSIKEIEFFLRNLNKGIKSFKIYKFLKWRISCKRFFKI